MSQLENSLQSISPHHVPKFSKEQPLLSDYSYYDSEDEANIEPVDDDEYTQVFEEPPNANVVEVIQTANNLILHT